MKKKLSPKQEKAIVAVLNARTIEEGLRAVKIGKSTFYGWLKQSVFAEAYQQARREIVRQAYAILERNLSGAVDTLAGLLKSEDDRIKRLAAVNIIELYSKHAETEDIEKRLKALEGKILIG